MMTKLSEWLNHLGLLQGLHGLSGIAIYVAVAAWIVVVLGYFHSRHRTAWVGRLPFGAFFMDILDRLTNKAVLQSLLSQHPAGQTKAIDPVWLASYLKERVFGQAAVCDSVAQQIYIRFAKSARTKPVGVFLLAGPPATGKTHFGKQLSEALYGENAAILFEMAQFAQGHAASSLFGSAKSYAGSDTYGSLTAKLKAKPDCVVILDEFEKAAKDVHSRFLSAWNDGFVTETSTGEQIATTDAVFILTTNAAQREIARLSEQYAGDHDGYSEACKRLLADQYFAPEVLSRIDYVFPFLPLEGLDVARVVLSLIETNVKEFGLTLSRVAPEVLGPTIERFSKKGDDPRKIARAIEVWIGPQLAELKSRGATKVSLVDESGQVKVITA